MAQAKRGRPRKPGARSPNGRLIAVADPGNQRVVERLGTYAKFGRTQAAQQIGDQVGRAWAAGLLDSQAVDGAILRDMGRRYGSLYWREFAELAPKTRQMEKQDRSVANDGDGDDRTRDYFAVLDRAARDAGAEAHAAMHALCVDGWWFPDTNAPWIARLINSALQDVGAIVPGERAGVADRDKLQAATAALLAMIQGSDRSAR